MNLYIENPVDSTEKSLEQITTFSIGSHHTRSIGKNQWYFYILAINSE